MMASIWGLVGVSKPLLTTRTSCVSGSFGSLFSHRGSPRQKPGCIALLAILCFMLLPLHAQARGTYMTVSEFVEGAFEGAAPSAQTLWLSGDMQERLKAIFGHPYKGLRLRYWKQADKSAWILEEIGKELPITLGVVVKGGAIERIRVLTYRESRGGEIRHPFFTEQFEGARLIAGDSLDRQIDGITGATLSVRAATRVAEAALALSQSLYDAGDTP